MNGAVTLGVLIDALKVIAYDERIRTWLAENDPMALQQVQGALLEIGENPVPVVMAGWGQA